MYYLKMVIITHIFYNHQIFEYLIKSIFHIFVLLFLKIFYDILINNVMLSFYPSV